MFPRPDAAASPWLAKPHRWDAATGLVREASRTIPGKTFPGTPVTRLPGHGWWATSDTFPGRLPGTGLFDEANPLLVPSLDLEKGMPYLNLVTVIPPRVR